MVRVFDCPECGTALEGNSGRGGYKHLLHCLHVEGDSLDRIREQALESRTENGRRVAFIVEKLQDGPAASGNGG